MKKILLFSSLLCVFSLYSQSGNKEKNAREITENKFLALTQVNGYTESVSPNGLYVTGGSGLGFLWNLELNGTIVAYPLINGTPTEISDVNSGGEAAGIYRDMETVISVTNSKGEVVGQTAAYMAGVWSEGTWKKLGLGTFQVSDMNKDYHGAMAFCISEDGKRVGGAIETAHGLFPCVWTYNETGNKWDFTQYSLPEGENLGGKINCMSSDGSIVGGWFTDSSSDRYPIFWKSPSEPVIIGDVMIGTTNDGCHGISENGKYIAFSSKNRGGIYDVETGTSIFAAGHEGAQLTGVTCVTNNGLAFGYSEFASFLGGRWRTAFAFSEALGFMDFGDFVNTFLPDMEVPADMAFDPNYKDLKVPMDVTGDGKVIVGWTGPSNMERTPWAIQIASEIIIYNKPLNLAVSVSDRNNVLLSWDAPQNDPENELKAYRIFRDGSIIENILANELNYTDECPNGKHSYSVAAVYENGISPVSNLVMVSIVDTYDIPLFENFESASFDMNYWSGSAESKWSINAFFGKGIYGMGASCENWGESYNDALVSRPLDATALENIYLTYALRSTTYSDPSQNKDTLRVEISDGNEWQIAKEYPGTRKETTYGIECLDISDLVKGKLFQIRFRVNGSGDSRIWDLDNVRIDTMKEIGQEPDDIIGLIKNDSAHLIWKNPTDAYELSYEQTPLHNNAMGNAGVPFIAATEYTVEDLAIYKGLYLTSITAYINQNLPEKELEIGLVIFEDGTKTLQDIPYFTANDWNTFVLDNPILIDGTKSLKFGINVIKHDVDEIPVAADSTDELVTGVDGKGNLFSEDGGDTWSKLSDYNNQYTGFPLAYNWSIIGNVTVSVSPSMLPVKDENLAGYILYRNGEQINEKLLYLPQFVDEEGAESDVYVVKTYYLDRGLLSPASKEYVLKVGTGLSSNHNVNELIVYPNPATEYIRIEGEYNKAVLISESGKVISTTGNNAIIPVKKLPEGIYLLELTTEKGKEVHKIFIKK